MSGGFPSKINHLGSPISCAHNDFSVLAPAAQCNFEVEFQLTCGQVDFRFEVLAPAAQCNFEVVFRCAIARIYLKSRVWRDSHHHPQPPANYTAFLGKCQEKSRSDAVWRHNKVLFLYIILKKTPILTYYHKNKLLRSTIWLPTVATS